MIKKSQAGFTLVEALIIILILVVVGFGGYYIWQAQQKPSSTSATTPGNITAQNKPYTGQEATIITQKTYDDYLSAVKQANSDKSNTQPVAQVGLMAVKDNLSADLYNKAAAVTQATPFSCTAQYVSDKYTATLKSADGANAVVSVSISNGGGLHTDGMSVVVDLTSLKITSVTCPN